MIPREHLISVASQSNQELQRKPVVKLVSE